MSERPNDRTSSSHEALTILLTALEARVPGTLRVRSSSSTRDAAVAALNRCLRGVLVERGELGGGPAPPAA